MNGKTKNRKDSTLRVSIQSLSGSWMTRTLFMTLLLLGSVSEASAQLTCQGTPLAPVFLDLDLNCNYDLTANQVLLDPAASPGPKTFEVRDSGGNLIATGSNTVTLSGDYANEVLEVTVIDDNTNDTCLSYIELVDVKGPVFVSCDNVTISCNADASPDAIGYPSVEDNCDNSVVLSYVDAHVGPDCNLAPPNIDIITRTWTAIDDAGNVADCSQTIFVERVTLMDIVFPGTANLDCSSPDLSPGNTGRPQVAGNNLANGGPCQIEVLYTDVVDYTCLPSVNSYTVTRTWTVTNTCTGGNMVSYEQEIHVEDNTAPSITCPAPMTVGMDPGLCSGTVSIPMPTVSDNCSAPGDILITVTTTYGETGFGPHLNVPPGNHTIIYTAEDECGNASVCQTNLVVMDFEAPTAICDEFTIMSIPSSGAGLLSAASLDDGSYDNCSPILFTASRDGVNFSDFVAFDCNDVGQTIPVTLRVTELVNPNNFNDCNVMVTVQDPLAPMIVCPPDAIAACTDDLSDLSQFGYPTVTDLCGYTLTSDSTINIDNCGAGIITRTFTATDNNGNSTSCTQTITVENLNPYDGTGITWPLDYTIDDACLPIDFLDPEDLAPPYDFPILPNTACAMLATSYSDQVFYVSYPACYKIVRTWTVMDWCQFDPNNPTGGIWTYSQLIKANDNIAPSLEVPDDQTIAVGADCSSGYVSMATAQGMDCATTIQISNDSPYADGNGADASGDYPIGTTVVTFTATDGCGNSTTASTTITVADNTPPTILCNSGITVELGLTAGIAGVTVPADIFIAETFDNCSDLADLEVYFRVATGMPPTGPPTTTSLEFGCADLGLHQVEVWVVDEVGNADYCQTFLVVQDNMNVCPNVNIMATIAGAITTEEGDEVDDVSVFLSNTGAIPDTMMYGAFYGFYGVPTGYDYTVEPVRDDNAGDGVSTWDIVLITRHILGIDPLPTPYQIIAADANGSGSVTTLDVVYIRQVVLGLANSFPGVHTWRFVDAAHNFIDPTNPFTGPIPEVVNLDNLSGDAMDVNFIGVKVGDIDHSGMVNLPVTLENRQQEMERSILELEDRRLRAGERMLISLEWLEKEPAVAAQWSLQIDPNKLEVLDFSQSGLPGFTKEQVAGNQEDGLYSLGWYHTVAQEVQGKEAWAIEVRALEEVQLSEAIQLADEPTKAEVYLEGGSPKVPVLSFTNASTASVLFGNNPNPFQFQTTIELKIAGETKNWTLEIYNTQGQLVYQERQWLDAGKQSWTVELANQHTNGLYWYTLTANDEQLTGKMIMQK